MLLVHSLFRQTASQQHQLWCLDFKDGFPFGFAATLLSQVRTKIYSLCHLCMLGDPWHFVSLVVGMLACDRGKLRWNQADLHKLVAVSMRINLTFIISYVSCASQHYRLVWPIASGSTTGFFVWLFAGICWQINICLYTHPLGGWEVVLLVFAIHDCYSGWRWSDTLSDRSL